MSTFRVTPHLPEDQLARSVVWTSTAEVTETLGADPFGGELPVPDAEPDANAVSSIADDEDDLLDVPAEEEAIHTIDGPSPISR